MAENNLKVTIIMDFKTKLSLWMAFKLRLAGADTARELLIAKIKKSTRPVGE